MNTKSFHRIFFLLLFSSFSSFSQTPEDAKKKYPIRNVIKNNKTVSTLINTDFNYNFCDDDGDGIMTIDLTTILDEVQVAVSGDLQVDDPKLLIGTSEDKILQIDNILLNPITTIICELSENTYDVAMNANNEFFTTEFNSIKKANIATTTCNLTSVLDLGGNSLSFDISSLTDSLGRSILSAK